MNRLIGLLILLLYFGNYHLSLLLANGDNDFYWDVNKSIYSIIIILALKYKFDNSLLSNVFIAIILNNIYVLLQKKEFTYNINDAYFIIVCVVLQNLKRNVSIAHRIYSFFTHRVMGGDSSDCTKKK